MKVIVLGSTGLVGSSILKQLEKSTIFNNVVTVSRRAPKTEDPKVEKLVEPDSSKWQDTIKGISDAKTFISSFGTTKAAAGSASNFVKIDHGINYESAKAAKEAGVETFVLVSSIGANSSSWFFYLQTKGKLEDDIIALGFPRTIILRPGVLLGKREKSQGLKEKITVSVLKHTRGNLLSSLFNPIYDDEVAKAAVKKAEEPFIKSDKPQVSILHTDELLKLAKD